VKVLASSPAQALIPDLVTSAGTQLLIAVPGWVLPPSEGQAALRHEAAVNFVCQQEAHSGLLSFVVHQGQKYFLPPLRALT